MRRAGFALFVCALLAVAALGACGPRRSSVGTSPGHGATIRPARLSGRTAHEQHRARPGLRRFILAFLAAEVGRGGRSAARIIRAGATATLSRRLLGRLPRPSSAEPGRVRLAALRLHRLPGRRDLLLASGVARRPRGPEPFSFIFIRRGGRWLALAPAE